MNANVSLEENNYWNHC